MKITVYTLTTSDDGSLDTQCFATEREMLAEVWTNIELHCGAEFPKIKAQFGDNADKACDEAVHEYNMTLDMEWSANEIEVPDRNHSIIADTLDYSAAADIWYDAAAYGDVDVGRLIDATQTAMTDAAKALRTMPDHVGLLEAAEYGVDFCDMLISDGKSDQPAKYFKEKLQAAIAAAKSPAPAAKRQCNTCSKTLGQTTKTSSGLQKTARALNSPVTRSILASLFMTTSKPRSRRR